MPPPSSLDSVTSSRGPVRVAVLNDHELVVEGVAGMLRGFPDRVRLEEVGTEAAPGQSVDIVLYDTYGTAAAGRRWSDFVGRGWSPRYVVQYDWKGDPGIAERLASQDGGAGVIAIPKWLEGEELVAALEEVVLTGAYSRRSTPSAESPQRQADPRPTVRNWPGKHDGLTERESEVVVLIVAGMSNQEIATALFLGVNTIKTYIRSAYRTMGVTSRSRAMLWGIDRGFRLDSAGT